MTFHAPRKLGNAGDTMADSIPAPERFLDKLLEGRRVDLARDAVPIVLPEVTEGGRPESA